MLVAVTEVVFEVVALVLQFERMNGASRGLPPPGDPHYFNRTRGDAFRKADLIVIVGPCVYYMRTSGERARQAGGHDVRSRLAPRNAAAGRRATRDG